MNKNKEDLKSLKVDLSTNGGNTQQKDKVKALEVIANIKAKGEAKKSNLAKSLPSEGKSFVFDPKESQEGVKRACFNEQNAETSEFADELCEKDDICDEKAAGVPSDTIRVETEEGMHDDAAKQKINSEVGMLLILSSLLPELSEYSHKNLAISVVNAMRKKEGEKERITFIETEPALSPSKQIRLDVHAILKGFKFSSRGFSISLGKEKHVVPRSTQVEAGLFIHVDVEPQSSKLNMNTYLKRAAYYLAAVRVHALSKGANNGKSPDYTESTKAHSIWLSKANLSFIGETGVYHTAVYGGNLDTNSLNHTDLSDMNLEEIFIIDLPRVSDYYHKNEKILKGTRAEYLSMLSEYMLTNLGEESINRLKDSYNVDVGVVEGGGIVMETMNERWIREKDEKTAAEIAKIEAKTAAEVAEILEAVKQGNPGMVAEIEAIRQKYSKK